MSNLGESETDLFDSRYGKHIFNYIDVVLLTHLWSAAYGDHTMVTTPVDCSLVSFLLKIFVELPNSKYKETGQI